MIKQLRLLLLLAELYTISHMTCLQNQSIIPCLRSSKNKPKRSGMEAKIQRYGRFRIFG